MFKVAEFLIYAALRDALVNSGASEEVLFWFDAIDDGPLKGKTFSEFRKNPQMSVQELGEVYRKLQDEEEEKQRKKQENVEKQFPKSLVDAMGVASIPQVKQWLKNVVFKKYKNDLSNYTIEQIKDRIELIENWINSVDKEELRNLQIANFTFDQMFTFVQKMEEDKRKADENNERFSFKSVAYGPEWKNEMFNGFRIVELDKKPQLVYESSRLNHCVGQSDNYINKIKRGESRIFSLRDSSNKPFVTIETSPDLWVFKQSFGATNAQPNAVESAMLNEWKRSLRTDEELIEKAKGENKDQIQVAQFVSRGNNDEIIDELLKSDETGRESIGSAVENDPKSILQALSQNDKLNEEDYQKIYEKSQESKTIIFNLARNPAISDSLFKEILDKVYNMHPYEAKEIAAGVASGFKVNILSYEDLIKLSDLGKDVTLLLLNNPTLKSDKARDLMKELGRYSVDSIIDSTNFRQMNFDPKFINDFFSVFGYENWPKFIKQIDNFKDEDLKKISKITGVPYNENLRDIFVKDILIYGVKKYKEGGEERNNIIDATRLLLQPDRINEFSNDELKEIAKEGVSALQSQMLKNQDLDQGVLDVIIKNPSNSTNIGTAISHPQINEEILNNHYNSEIDVVRRYVSKSDKATPEMLDYLSKDSDFRVLDNVAKNKKTSPESLVNLYNRSKESSDHNFKDIMEMVIINPNFPLEYAKQKMADEESRYSSIIYADDKQFLNITPELANYVFNLTVNELDAISLEDAVNSSNIEVLKKLIESDKISNKNFNELFNDSLKYSDVIGKYIKYSEDADLIEKAVDEAVRAYNKDDKESERLVNSTGWWTADLVDNVNLTKDQVLKILKNFPHNITKDLIKKMVAVNGELPENCLKAIAENGDPHLLATVAEVYTHDDAAFKNMPKWFFRKFFQDDVWKSVGNTYASNDLIENLSEDLIEDIAENPSIVNQAIFKYPENDILIDKTIEKSENPSSLLRSLLNRMAESGNVDFNKLILKLINSPKMNDEDILDGVVSIGNRMMPNRRNLSEELYSTIYNVVKRQDSFESKEQLNSILKFLAKGTSNPEIQRGIFDSNKENDEVLFFLALNDDISEEVFSEMLELTRDKTDVQRLLIQGTIGKRELARRILPNLTDENLYFYLETNGYFLSDQELEYIKKRAEDASLEPQDIEEIINDANQQKIKNKKEEEKRFKNSSVGIFKLISKAASVYERLCN